MVQLRRLSLEAVAAALEQASNCRLFHEPEAAESMCTDILAVDPNNQRALRNLLLARADQLELSVAHALSRAQEVLPRIEDDYERTYLAGRVCERQATTLLRRRGRRSAMAAHDWFQRAMRHYEDAIEIRPPGTDAILRWNSCLRLIERNPHCGPDLERHPEPGIE